MTQANLITARRHSSTQVLVPLYVCTMLLSACLLFLVQPLFARMALPLLGGTPAVWAIAMLFFQGVLLGGYAYAHVLKKYVAPRTAVSLHVVLMAGAWFFLPVAIPPSDVPAGGATAGIWLLGLMARAIGYPFFFLSATAPLLQSWFARTAHKDASNPYFLYAASNIGSIGALLLYPFIVEPSAGLHLQAQLWSVGYGVLILAIATSGFAMLANFRPLVIGWGVEKQLAVPTAQKLWWVFMAFVPSALLVAWTNHITTDIASAPFLWLPPLVLFLLTFVLVFREKSLVPVRVARILQLVSLPIAFVMQFALPLDLAVWVMAVGAISFFSTAIICHRQLYEARPDAARLTEFYMLMSLGGVLGGLFVSLLAPLIFNSVAEYPILLVLGVFAQKEVWAEEKLRMQLRQPTALIAVFIGVLVLDAAAGPGFSAAGLATVMTFKLAALSAIVFLLVRARHFGAGLAFAVLVALVHLLSQPTDRVAMRSYFGVLSVSDGVANEPYRFLTHGTTMHGAERLDELTRDFKDRPHALTYYSPQGGMARALLGTQERLAKAGNGNGIFRVIGLGTGSLACYKKPGEDWAYYEIDRDVIKVARDPQQFTFLSQCAPDMKMIEGDARITLANGPQEKADYLLVDAFSSDSIPVHLITTEAMRLYFSHLKDDGVLVMHVTNRYMDLVPVVAANLKAIDPSFSGRVVDFVPGKVEIPAMHSIAIVMSRNPQALAALDAGGGTQVLTANEHIDPWTDDFANLPAAILRRVGLTRY